MDGLLFGMLCSLNAWDSILKVVVVINYVSKFKMPCKWSCIVKCSRIILSAQPPKPPHLFCSNCRQGPPGCHDLHDILRLFHAPNVIYDAMKEPGDSIHNSYCLILKMFQDVHPRNKHWPITRLFNLSPSKKKPLSSAQQRHKGCRSHCWAQHTDQSETHLSTYTTITPVIVIFWRSQFVWVIFSLNHLDEKHHTRQATACRVVFITKWVGLAWTKHPPRTSPPLKTNWHGFIETQNPWQDKKAHIFSFHLWIISHTSQIYHDMLVGHS